MVVHLLDYNNGTVSFLSMTNCFIFCLLLSILHVSSQMSSPGAIDKIPNTSGQYIMLTFDDGPHGTLTPQLLDILKAKKAKV